MDENEFCRVCGSPNHINCSMGCAGCDDPNSPMPRYAWTFCEACHDSFCAECLQQHQCEQEFNHWTVSDLALANFHGKWKAAREFADRTQKRGTMGWWMIARKHYLELGGYYKHQLPTASAGMRGKGE